MDTILFVEEQIRRRVTHHQYQDQIEELGIKILISLFISHFNHGWELLQPNKRLMEQNQSENEIDEAAPFAVWLLPEYIEYLF